ncbi:4-hydroxyphenylpyruvate dioxygenase family protein [Thermostichus vulcanus]|uniref:VOC family protein n=1 Tax=Thermostichus vulcanus str. 'Rupite' TaxID=2813851 RepID=A0ABT0CDK1_THEVL|nr:VOC family protein [Thermostichus vulcanus]MCJ2543400.1 VOC family protein [Thermostichus vulcanus str. 'Rupite']
MNQPISGIQGIHHLHFYLWDLPYWQEQFCQVWGFQIEQQAPHTLDLCQGSIRLRLSQPAHAGDEVDRYLQQHSPGIVDVALAVGKQDLSDLAGLLQRRGAEVGWIPAERESPSPSLCLRTPYGLRHSLIPEPGSAPLYPSRLFSHLDHVVLNVGQGSLQAAADWYGQMLGWERLYHYSVGTEHSGLESWVVGDLQAGIQLAINEPTSATSQIQEFLDAYPGPGIQHVALHSPDILSSLRQLRRGGVEFLQVPAGYYSMLEGKRRPDLPEMAGIHWPDLQEQGVLLDSTLPASDPNPAPLLLQTFTQPLFGKPTFFFEIIQRLGGATGFGEGNFQALFEALEQQQLQRQQQLLAPH